MRTVYNSALKSLILSVRKKVLWDQMISHYRPRLLQVTMWVNSIADYRRLTDAVQGQMVLL